MLDIPTRGNIAFDGRTIFYINENSLLTAYDTKTHKARPFRNMVASDFCLTDQGLYFINRMDSDCVYLCGRDGGGSLKISNEPALSIDYDGEKVRNIGQSMFTVQHSYPHSYELPSGKKIQISGERLAVIQDGFPVILRGGNEAVVQLALLHGGVAAVLLWLCD